MAAETCKWFALCGQSAVAELPHPVLGKVPVCDRCLHMTMVRTEFDDYDGVYNMPTILYRLLHDVNAGLEDGAKVSDLDAAVDEWEIPIGDLLCIEGFWKDAGFGKNGDPTCPDWKDLGIEDNFNTAGVHYTEQHMIITGHIGMYMCFWIFKKTGK